MNFRTQVELPKREAEIRHSDRIMLFGSCFAENIGNLLLTNKFRCDVNPFGILYNPLSVVEALWQILSHQTYMEEDLFYAGGCWHSWMHHSVFSASTAASCLSSINTRLAQASAGLPQLDWLVITWGTAFAYWLKERTMVVGNCHKQPDSLFTMLCLVGGQGAGKSTFFRLLAVRDEWFSDDLRKLDDDNVYRKLQGHWMIEMSEMMATANAKSIEEIKSFLSRQKEVYKIPYETHPADRPRQCVFGGTSNALDFLPLDRSGNRRFIPVMVYPEQA